MEIYQLRAFVAVARHGNFTKAASELHLSQPTVSGQIKALEEDLGVLLFERRASGVVTTATGAALLPKAEKLLADVRGFKAHARQMGAQLPAKILLGTVIDARFLRLGQFMSAMRARHPQVEIETHHGLSGWVMNAVRKGDLDCGFFVGPVRQADVTATLLTEMTYRIVAPCDWAVRIADAGWAEIAAMPWIWAPEEGSYPQIAMEMFREHGVEPNKVAVADRDLV
ncbi:MAG TPA: LysR family transcriptional regulator, partial [Noviherbaspirillum sp.]|nr:LysR family transcriptional regulator [Noviherbaspirillum sp.]